MYDPKLKQEVIQKLNDEKKRKSIDSRLSARDNSVNLAKGDLDKDVFKASGGSMGPDLTEPVTRIKAGTDKIDKKGIQKLTDIADFEEAAKMRSLKSSLVSTMEDAIKRGDKQMISKLQMIGAKLGKGLGTGLKALPLVGGIAAAAMTGEASAALPVIGDSESAGMSPESENMMMSEIQANKDYKNSQASKDKLEALLRLKGRE